jgi:endonuclease III
MDIQHKLTQVTIFEAAMAPQIGVDGALHRVSHRDGSKTSWR